MKKIAILFMLLTLTVFAFADSVTVGGYVHPQNLITEGTDVATELSASVTYKKALGDIGLEIATVIGPDDTLYVASIGDIDIDNSIKLTWGKFTLTTAFNLDNIAGANDEELAADLNVKLEFSTTFEW